MSNRTAAPTNKLERVISYCFYGLLFLFLLLLPLFIIPRLQTDNPVIHSKELLTQLLLPPLLLLGLALKPWWRRGPIDLPEFALIGYFVTCLLSAVLSRGRFLYCVFESWIYWGFIILALILGRLKFVPYRWIFLTMVTSAALCSVYGLSTYFGYDPLKNYFPYSSDIQARSHILSFLGNPEYLGTYLAPVCVLTFGICILSKTKSLALISLFLVIIFTCAILLTGARGALLGMVIGMIIISIFVYRHASVTTRRTLNLLIAAIVLIGAFVITVFSFPNPLNSHSMRLANRFTELMDIRSASIKERVAFYTVTGRIINRNWMFGTGPGTYKLEFYPTIKELAEQEDDTIAMRNLLLHLKGRVAEHPHNDYLEIWADTGTFGFGFFLLIAITIVVFAFSRSYDLLDETRSLTLKRQQIVFATLVAIFINAIFSFPFHLPVRASMAWILIGLYFALTRDLHVIAERTDHDTNS